MSAIELLSAHSELGPSASERWCPQRDGGGGCTASVAAARGADDPGSSFAAEGTAAHVVTEWVRLNDKPGAEYPHKEIRLPKPNGEEWVFEVTKDMMDAADVFARVTGEFGGHHSTGDAFYEMRVHYTDWVHNGFGTSDDIRIQTKNGKTICKITDFKYGEGVQVFAPWNTQLMLYAAGVLQDLGMLWEIDEFELAVCQPRLDHYDEWQITTFALKKWLDEVAKPAAEESRDPARAQYRPGEHCRFCRIKQTCKARYTWVMDLTKFAGSELHLSGDEIARILPHIDVIRGALNDLEATAMQMIQRREKVGDYKLVEGRSNRAWAIENDVMLIERLRKKGKLSLEQVAPRKVITITEAEKLLGKKHPLLAIRKDASDPVALVVKPKGKPKLAPASDPRPAIIDDVEFGDISEESQVSAPPVETK